MVLPCVVLLAVFAYWPLVRGAFLSMHGTDLLGNPTRFIGAGNYIELVTDPALRRALLTTGVITTLSVILAIAGALAAALPLRRAARRPRAVLSVLLSLPFAYSASAASAVFAGLFAPAVGTINQVLATVGLHGPGWLESPAWAVASVSIATAWYEFGFAFLVVLAALTQVDQGIIEAAALDGASELRTAWSVIIPVIRPSLIFLVVTQTISGLQVFTQVQVLTRGGPAGATSTMVYELYQRAFGEALPRLGSASTLALALLALVLAVTAAQFFVVRRSA
ncbi:carbohydrate ABC transporter permease [Nonomuraea turcica]|uniref:carbohydrate ABC transporter permease n=1 Tax=Nonomuraea sp. G32 TaxID=3067274 RepID=UPI00273C1269|nr:sugar ABC transporter permease [Nonomuraea sp. G32]MDP4501272.1 sugar ABC transporter permease [Nonomuraea sp. G32]